MIALFNNFKNNFVYYSIRFHATDDLLKAINELTGLVQSIQKELAYQNVEIKQTQGLIESCSACQAVEVNRNGCAYASPCFQGQCRVFKLRLLISKT